MRHPAVKDRPVEIITDLAELGRRIEACNDALRHGSDDAMREMFKTFRMDFSACAPADPFSDEYRRFQMTLYETIAGKPYVLLNERSYVEVDAKATCPFPYYTQSTGTAGHHLLAIGFLLCKLDLPPGARIVEFGPGWGNSTIELARLGLDVTAVDIEPSFCEVVRRRAAQLGVRVAVVEADFFWAESVEAPYDAALFFECFHHCDDHLRLLRALHGAVVPGGSVFLASEPIIGGYDVPWGLRMDGEALWAMRNFGWLELGYDEGYFREALARTGWRGTRHECSTVPWASVWQLQRLEDGGAGEAGAWEAARNFDQEGSASFLKKGAKNFSPFRTEWWGLPCFPSGRSKEAKVFWFFFSKKNRFLAFHHARPGLPSAGGVLLERLFPDTA